MIRSLRGLLSRPLMDLPLAAALMVGTFSAAALAAPPARPGDAKTVAPAKTAEPRPVAPARPADPRGATGTPRPTPPAASARDMSADFALLDNISGALSRVARLSRPSVVSVQTLTNRPGRRREEASGSGVIYDARGHIITSNHVIDGANRIDVILADGRKFRATLVGADPKTDTAVLRITATQITPAHFADSSRVEVGQLVMAIGSPFMLAQTVTHGIVSATGRSNLDMEGVDYQSFIQTDAPTNPGNSGGALVNTHGEVIGINTAIASGSGDFAGVAFATPSNTVLWAAKGIISGKPLVRGYLGVSLSDDTVEMVGYNSTEGAMIKQITSDSPAGRAGLQEMDLITQLDATKIMSQSQLRAMIAELRPGSRVVLTILRSGKERKIEVTIGELPSNL